MNRQQRRLLDKVKILKPDDDVSAMIYIGNRIDDGPPRVPSATRICNRCRNDIWVDNRSTAHADRCKEIICVPCAVKE